MAPAPSSPLPGSMTVPPLFGWEVILAVLVLLITVAVVFFLASATGTGQDDRSDWEAWLDARSGRRRPRVPERQTASDETDDAGQGRAPNEGRPVSSGRTR